MESADDQHIIRIIGPAMPESCYEYIRTANAIAEDIIASARERWASGTDGNSNKKMLVKSITIITDDLQSCLVRARFALTTSPRDARFSPHAGTFVASRVCTSCRMMRLMNRRKSLVRSVGRRPATFRCLRRPWMILTLAIIRNLIVIVN